MNRLAHIEPTWLSYSAVTLRDRTAFVHVASSPTAFYSAEDQADVGASHAAALNGYCFDPTGEEPRVVRARDLWDLSHIEALAGEFAYLRVGHEGLVTATSDPHRVQSLFWIDTPRMFGVSTRPAMLAWLARAEGRDELSAASLATTGYLLGERTAYEAVKAVPQGHVLLWDGRKPSFVNRRGVIAGGTTRRLRADLADNAAQDELSRGSRIAAQTVILAGRPNERIRLGITGGKDSRLTLAMCLAAGLRDRIELFTRGPADHPDVIVGSMLARAAGMDHYVIEPEVPSAQPARASVENLLDRLRIASYQTDGMTGGWDPFTATRTGRGAALSGLMGEILKAFAKSPTSALGSRPSAAAVVTLQSPFDPAGFVRADFRAALAAELETRFEELLDAGYSVEDLPDIFYYENRIPNWLGHSKQVHTFSETGLMPLGAVPLARLAFSLAPAERRAEMLHYKMIQHLAPELVEVPFAINGWSAEVGAPAIDPIPLPAARPQIRAHGSWQYSINDDPLMRDAVRAMVSDLRAPVTWSAVDQAIVLDRLTAGPPLSMKEIISLLGVLASALHESGEVLARKLASPGT